MRFLAYTPRNSKKLSGGGSKWRIRVGDYKILYELDDAQRIVKVYRVAHRREVYR
ncbi:MAG: type II toxin-antitoxin system RelE/ParE family toxin [Deltaproteobacteria bacterium]|nr:type II toxin-antitoxin system RelE/ParE family toxin [Deltaproteobacteria bacterium]